MCEELKSILDDDIYDVTGEETITLSFLKKLSHFYELDPKPFCDCLGRELKINDLVLYSDKDYGPRPGIIIKIDEDGDYCSVSYTGGGNDCKDMCGNIVCNDLVYKCLKIDLDKLTSIIG